MRDLLRVQLTWVVKVAGLLFKKGKLVEVQGLVLVKLVVGAEATQLGLDLNLLSPKLAKAQLDSEVVVQ